MKTNFESLQIYQLAETLADEIWRVIVGWDYLAKDSVGKQLVRAADSIGANIAEGSGRGTPSDNRRFLRMARGSLYESKHWLRRAYKRKLLTTEQIETLSPLLNELLPKLNSYLKFVSQTADKSKAPLNHANKDQKSKLKDQ